MNKNVLNSFDSCKILDFSSVRLNIKMNSFTSHKSEIETQLNEYLGFGRDGFLY